LKFSFAIGYIRILLIYCRYCL